MKLFKKISDFDARADRSLRSFINDTELGSALYTGVTLLMAIVGGNLFSYFFFGFLAFMGFLNCIRLAVAAGKEAR